MADRDATSYRARSWIRSLRTAGKSPRRTCEVLSAISTITCSVQGRQREDHEMMSQIDNRQKPAALLGVFDFFYQHYALGDLLTNQINLAVIAIEQGLRHVDLLVMVNPERPSARQQTFITRSNYIAHLHNVMPVFACNPLLRSFRLIRDLQTFNFLIALQHRNHLPMCPDLKSHLKIRTDFPIDHRRINAFHARHGYVPQLSAPRGY